MAEKNMQMEQAQEQAGGMKPEKKQTGASGKSESALWATRTVEKQPCLTPLPAQT